MLRTCVILFTLGLGGCATFVSSGNVYHPRAVDVPDLDGATLFTAVKDNAASHGWKVNRVDARAGELEALGREEGDVDFAQRERWLFTVRGGQVRVRMVMEARFERGGAWESSGEVCDGYTYEREDTELRGVELRARQLVALRSVRPGLLANASAGMRPLAGR